MYAQRKHIYISQQPYSIMSSAISKKHFNKIIELGTATTNPFFQVLDLKFNPLATGGSIHS